MDFTPDPHSQRLGTELRDFLDSEVMPAETQFHEQLATAEDPWARPPVLRRLMDRARDRGLWNLFLPGEHGAGLTQLQYAPLAELSGWSPNLAPAAMNCAAPDSGNMELLEAFATPEQRERWLTPLLSGEIRSAFCMTEPDVASSDARNIGTRIVRDGDCYRITGRKWYISGAMNPEARIFIVMGKTDPEASVHRQQSMILVPRDTPGVTVRRALSVLGYDDREHGGHAEIDFKDVVVPATNLIKGEGEGFAIAQARLGPGRIHHCMRLLGMAERALALAARRSWDREAFGGALATQGTVRTFIAESRITMESLRLLVLKTAWLMDMRGNREAHTEIQAIKIAVPRAVQRILDGCVQLFGAAGLSQDTPLAAFFAAARGLRLADGPDEGHLSTLGRAQLKAYRPA